VGTNPTGPSPDLLIRSCKTEIVLITSIIKKFNANVTEIQQIEKIIAPVALRNTRNDGINKFYYLL
jgi:hypothetical protein